MDEIRLPCCLVSTLNARANSAASSSKPPWLLSTLVPAAWCHLLPGTHVFGRYQLLEGLR